MPKQFKIVVFAPKDSVDDLIDAMSKTGAGNIGAYTHCAFITKGQGNWFSTEESNPTVGAKGQMSRETEYKIEMVCPEDKIKDVIKAVKRVHPYEQAAIDIYELHFWEETL